MAATFKQYSPAELYNGIEILDSLEADTEGDQPMGFRRTGSAFLDAFTGNLFQFGLLSSTFHAKRLGISSISLCYTVQTLTGLTYSEFTEQCIVLMVCDFLKQNKMQKKDLAKRVGMSPSGLYRLLQRRGIEN